MQKKVKHYAELIRLNKPIGVLLLLLPCLFAISLFSKSLSDESLVRLVALFSLGAFIMRSAGCIINDVFDRKIDAKVDRTRFRPLAQNAIKVKEALILLALLLIMAFIILVQFNQKTIIAGFIVLFLVITYPLMKRITFYPQLFLGLTFNYGVLMVDLAVNNTISTTTIFLFVACVIWTVIYDTFYAFQDIEDDIKIGVKSTARKFSNNIKFILATFALIMFFLLFYIGFLEKFSINFFITNFLAFAYLLFLIMKCNYFSPANCLQKFKANFFVGILILIAFSYQ